MSLADPERPTLTEKPQTSRAQSRRRAKRARFTTSGIRPDIVQVMIYLHDVAQGRWRGTGAWSSEGRPSTLSRTPAYLLNRNKAATVRFEDDVLHGLGRVQKLPLISRLTVLTKQGQAITVSGLDNAAPQKASSPNSTKEWRRSSTMRPPGAGTPAGDRRNGEEQCPH